MAKILFPSSTAPGERPNESSGRLINAIAEPLQDGAPAGYVIKRAPGLRQFADTGLSDFRGGVFVDPYLYVGIESSLTVVNSSGAVATADSLSGSGPIYMARNNKVPVPDKVLVSSEGAFVFTDNDVSDLSDGDLPQPSHVFSHGGYFFFPIADGRCFASGLNDTGINANDYTKAESNPDGLLMGHPYGRDILLWGQNSGEVWTNTGEPTGFPYSYTTTIPIGLAGKRAIAGWEDGYNGPICFVGNDNAVHQLSGYTAPKISPPQLERLIEGVADKADIDCSVFVVGGHTYFKVRAPGFCWVYDFSTKWWHERQSYMSHTWRAFGNTVNAFGKWLTGDADSGVIASIEDGWNRELENQLIWHAESIAMEAFAVRLAVARADFNFIAGTGIANGEDPIERQPQVEISWSDDGGTNWTTPLLRPIGPQQITKWHPYVARCGLTTAKGRRWRLRVPDPVYVGLLGGDMAVEARAA